MRRSVTPGPEAIRPAPYLPPWPPPPPCPPPCPPVAIGIGVSEPPVRRPTIGRAPIPITVRTQGPIIPVLKALVLTHRIQIGLLHVVEDLTGDALLAELCQLGCRQAVDGLRLAHFVEEGFGRHTLLGHLDHVTDRDGRRGLFHS
jgi:hypothetical protein